VGIIVIALALLLAMTGVHRQVSSLVPVWTRSWILPKGSLPESAKKDEIIVQLRAENLLLKRRLMDFTDLKDQEFLLQGRTWVPGHILAVSLDRGQHFVEIDAGTASHGVERDQAVIAGRSLVGRIAGEKAGRSLVRLLSDTGSRIPIMIMQGTEAIAEGLCEGTGETRSLRLSMLQVAQETELTKGLEVVTSPLLPAIPAGLVVGTIDTAERRITGDWTVTLTPIRPLGTFDAVMVIGPVAEATLPTGTRSKSSSPRPKTP
jgi:cell shape-determining protein MreC